MVRCHIMPVINALDINGPGCASGGNLANLSLGVDAELAVHPAGLRDEEVAPAGEDEEDGDEDDDNVHQDKRVQVRGVVVHEVVLELGVGEAEDEADGGAGHVLEDDGPERV